MKVTHDVNEKKCDRAKYSVPTNKTQSKNFSVKHLLRYPQNVKIFKAESILK